MLTLIIILALILLYAYYISYNKIPILMYHRIDRVRGDRNTLAPEKFEQQLQYLAENGYHTVTMDELYEHYARGLPLPKKSVVLTFDDGYVDNLTIAMPLLEKYHMRGNVFAISNWLGKENKWENFGKAPTLTMNQEQLLQWQAAGHYVGCHTCNHPFLSKIAPVDLTQELTASKAKLECILQRPVDCICYPYGDFSQEVLQAVRQAGFKTGLAIFYQAPLASLNLFALPRIPIPSGQKMWEFKLKVSKIHLIFALLRQIEKSLKGLKH